MAKKQDRRYTANKLWLTEEMDFVAHDDRYTHAITGRVVFDTMVRSMEPEKFRSKVMALVRDIKGKK